MISACLEWELHLRHRSREVVSILQVVSGFGPGMGEVGLSVGVAGRVGILEQEIRSVK